MSLKLFFKNIIQVVIDKHWSGLRDKRLRLVLLVGCGTFTRNVGLAA